MRRILFALLALTASLTAGEADPDHNPVKASLIAETKGFAPGRPLFWRADVKQVPEQLR